MPIRKSKAKPKTSRLGTAITAIAPVESPIPESLSENQQASSCTMVDLPSGEVPSKVSPALESSSKDQPTPEGSSRNGQSAEEPAKDLPAGGVPKDLPHVGSPSEDQPTTQVQGEDQQTAEGATANQQAEKAPEDTPASESLPNGRSTAEGLTANLPEGEIPKEPTESSSQDQSTAERPSEDVRVEGLPIITPAAKSLPGSGELSGAIPFLHLPCIL